MQLGFEHGREIVAPGKPIGQKIRSRGQIIWLLFVADMTLALIGQL